MATSVEDICNLALLIIGNTKGISSINEDSSDANVCLAVYEQDRDEVLSAYAWPFATRRAKPAPLVATTLDAGDVPTGWEYAYAVPADAVAGTIRSIFGGMPMPNPANAISFATEYDAALGQNIILTNEDQPEFVYTVRVTDVTKFSALFVRALAARIAEDLVLGLRKDPKLAQVAHGYYVAALGEARADAGRNQSQPQTVPPHIAARR